MGGFSHGDVAGTRRTVNVVIFALWIIFLRYKGYILHPFAKYKALFCLASRHVAANSKCRDVRGKHRHALGPQQKADLMRGRFSVLQEARRCLRFPNP